MVYFPQCVQQLPMPLWKTGLAHGDRVTALDLEPMDETRKLGQGNLKCKSFPFLSILCFVRFHLHLIAMEPSWQKSFFNQMTHNINYVDNI